MFSSMSFSTSDTTEMRDSILALFGTSTGMASLPEIVSAFNIYPNPATDFSSINLELKALSTVLIDLTDMEGKVVSVIMNEKQNGIVNKQFSTSALPAGNYLVRLRVNGNTATRQLSVVH